MKKFIFDDLEIVINENLRKLRSYKFKNGYEISVLLLPYYGIDGYEVAIKKDGKLCYDTDVTDDVVPGLTKKEVETYMNKIAKINYRKKIIVKAKIKFVNA